MGSSVRLHGRYLDVEGTWRNMHPVLHTVKLISSILLIIGFWVVIIGGIIWKGWSFLGIIFEWGLYGIVIISMLALFGGLVKTLFMQIGTKRKFFTVICLIMLILGAANGWLDLFHLPSSFYQFYGLLCFVIFALAITGD